MIDWEPLKSFIRELATASAQEIVGRFRQRDLDVESKSDESPVTIADRRAEEVMREMIHQKFPGHGIVGEEYGTEDAAAEFVWVLDPIDGTKSFITGVPLFGTLIGLLWQGRPKLGCIHQPILGQYIVGDCEETYLDGVRVFARKQANLSEATLLATDPANLHKFQDATGFNALVDRVKLFRTFGDCYGYSLVASGWADVMVDPILNPWDLLPVVPIIEGANATVTDWQGKPVNSLNVQSAVAAVPELHEEVIQILNSRRLDKPPVMADS